MFTFFLKKSKLEAKRLKAVLPTSLLTSFPKTYSITPLYINVVCWKKCGQKLIANKVMYPNPWYRVKQLTYHGCIILFLKVFWFRSNLRHEAETGIYTQGFTFSHVRSKDQTFFTTPVVLGPVNVLPLLKKKIYGISDFQIINLRIQVLQVSPSS